MPNTWLSCPGASRSDLERPVSPAWKTSSSVSCWIGSSIGFDLATL